MFEAECDSSPIEFDHIANEIDYPNQLNICVDTTEKCIQVGAHYSYFPNLTHRPEATVSLKMEILMENNRELPRSSGSGMKAFFKGYSDILGARFNWRYQRLNYCAWVGKDAELIHRFCRDGKSLSDGLVYRFHAFRTLILKAVEYNEQHIIPAILFFGVDVPVLKSGLGASLWKTICSNSLTRNHLIFNRLYLVGKFPRHKSIEVFEALNLVLHKKPEIQDRKCSTYKKLLESLTLIPSSLLKRSSLCDGIGRVEKDGTHEHLNELVWVSNAVKNKKKVTDKNFIDDTWRLYRDTLRMAQRLNVPFSCNWSYNRIDREHKKLTLEHQ